MKLKKEGKKLLGHERRNRDLSDSMKQNNICIIGVSEEEKTEKGADGLCEQIIAENFPIWGRKEVSKSKSTRELPSKSTKPGPHHNISQ